MKVFSYIYERKKQIHVSFANQQISCKLNPYNKLSDHFITIISKRRMKQWRRTRRKSGIMVHTISLEIQKDGSVDIARRMKRPTSTKQQQQHQLGGGSGRRREDNRRQSHINDFSQVNKSNHASKRSSRSQQSMRRHSNTEQSGRVIPRKVWWVVHHRLLLVLLLRSLLTRLQQTQK